MTEQPDAPDAPDRDVSTTAWIVAAVVAIAIVLFVAYARREPGFDERVPDPPAASSVQSPSTSPDARAEADHVQ